MMHELPAYTAEDTLKIHGFTIGLNKNDVSLTLLRGFLKGWYERPEVETIRNFFKPGDKILELGSGTGLTTMTAAKIVGPKNIYPHELNPYLIAWANHNFSLNDLEIEIFRSAILPTAAEGEETDFHIHEDFWGSSLMELPEGKLKETISVKTADLAETIRARGINSLCLDIEGGEVELLTRGDLSEIQKIMMEVHPSQTGDSAITEMVAKLIQDGFLLRAGLCKSGLLVFSR